MSIHLFTLSKTPAVTRGFETEALAVDYAIRSQYVAAANGWQARPLVVVDEATQTASTVWPIPNPDRVALMVAEGWTARAADDHLWGACDKAVCGGVHLTD